MKNLKKILMALALVALLISSVVTIAIAEASYTGSVEAARDLLGAAEAENPAEALAAKSNKLAQVYTYLIDNPVNPKDEGYDALIEEYNAMTFKVAYLYFKDAGVGAVTDAEKSEKLAVVYKHLAAAPYYGSGASDFEIALGYTCVNDGCGASYEFTTEELFEEFIDNTPCPGDCPASASNVQLSQKITYSELEAQINEASVGIVGLLLDNLFSSTELYEGADAKGYYDLLKAQQDVVEFYDKFATIEYVGIGSKVYTGDIKVVNEILGTLDENSDYETVRAALSEIYSYLKATPVNPVSAEYYSFINGYNLYCNVMMEKLGEKIDSVASADEKIALLVEFSEVLTGKNAPAVYFSENVVAAYNSLCEDICSEFEIAGGVLEVMEELVFEAPVVIFDALNVGEDGVVTLPALLDYAETLPAGDAKLKAILLQIYKADIIGKALDVNDAEIKGYYDRYAALACNYVNAKYVEEMRSLVQVGDRYTVLVAFREFVSEYPLCEEVVNLYNEARIILRDDATALYNKIGSDKLPVYTEAKKEDTTLSYDILNDFYNDFSDAYEAYKVASAEDMAAKLTAMQAAAKTLYSYIFGSALNTEDAEYIVFIEKYDALRANVINALIEKIDAADGAEEKLARINDARSFLIAVPLSFSTINTYNNKIAEIIADSAMLEKLLVSHVLYNVKAEIDGVLTNTSASKQELLESGLACAEYLSGRYDVTDPAYEEFKASFVEATELLGNAIYLDLLNVINNGTTDEISALVDYYFDYVNTVSTPKTVLGVRKALKTTGDTCKAIVDKIDKNFVDVAPVATEYEGAFALLAAYAAAEDFESKFEIFKEIYENVYNKNAYFNTVFMFGSSYAAFKEAFDAAYAEMENALIAYADATLSPAIICDNLAYIARFNSELSFSENVVNAYNDVLASAKSKGYSNSAETILASCPVVAYSAPEGFSVAYSRIFIALERAEKELASNNAYDFEEFYIALLLLGGNNDEAAKLDFGSAEFTNVLVYFNKVTNDVKNYLFKVLDDPDYGIDAKKNALESARDFIKANGFSIDMVRAYNDYIDVLYTAYQAVASDNFEAYQLLMNDLHDHLAACPVKESALSASAKAIYSSYKTLIEAAEYGEFEGYLDYFENLSGDTVLIYQNMIVDKLNAYINSYGLGSYSDLMLVNANLQVLMNKYFDAFDAYLATLESESAVKNEIIKCGADLRIMGCSSDLVKIYNARYGQSISAGSAAEKTGKGSITEFSALVAEAEKVIAEGAYADAEARCDAILAAIKEVVAYVNTSEFSTVDIKDDVLAGVDVIRAELEESMEEQKKTLNNSAPLSEFNNPVQIDYDHQDGKLYASSLGPSSDTSVRYMTLETEANGNKYAQMKVTTSASPYFNMTKNNLGSRLDDTNGLVIDLDVMSPEVLNFQLTFTEDGLNTGKRVTTRVLQIKNNQLAYLFGEYSKTREESYYPNYVEGVDAPITLTPGEWMHITIIMDIEDMMMELLVDYVSLGRKPIITAASSGGDDDTCRYGELRFQCSAANTTACFDNVLIYGGTAYRTLDYLDTMNTDEKFEFYVTRALDNSENPVNRVYAYTEAKALIPYVSSACDDIKVVFESFDVNDIKKYAHEQHMENLNNIVAPIDLDTLNSGNAATMNVAVSSALSYIESNRLYIDQADERFIAINEILVAAKARTAWLGNLEDYIEVIGRFHRATSHASLVRHFEEVQNYFMLCELNKADKLALAMDDPIATAFVNTMLLDESVQRLAPGMTFIEYYTVYAPARIQEQLYIENSGWILEYVEAIESIVPDKDELSREEYLEKLAILAEENADYVDPYMTAIRNIVNAEAFVYSIDGVAEALEIFELLDEVFFNALQEVHYSIIKEQLDKYLLTDSYIEKAGICAFIENYITKNAVDMSDSLGQQYMYSLNVYKEEIELYKKDYEAILAANTEAFIATVSKMSTYVTYSEIKPLYDLAIEKYYYNMNADSAEVREAIAVFETYEAALNAWEYNGAMFVNYVNNLNAATRQAQKYRALVNCARYVDYIDAGVEGVEEALATYNRELSAYIALVSPINSDISDVNDAVCAVRSESISATVLAIVKNLLTK